MVVPAGNSLVPSSPGGPAQGEREPGPADQPGGVLPGQGGEPGGFGDGQLDGADVLGEVLPGAGGDGRVAERDPQVSVLDLSVARVGVQVAGLAVAVAGGRGGKGDDAGQGVADGDLAELGKAGQRGVPDIPSKVRIWDWSQPSTSLPVLNVSSTGQRRPAMVMKDVMVAGRFSGAQHR